MEDLVVMFSNFYSGKRVFLTGHTGFKGAWLALWLEQMGAQVAAYSLEPPSSPSLWSLANVEGSVKRVGGDINNAADISAAVRSFKPEIVIHMAAQSLVRPSYDNPLETLNTNVMGTANLLEAIRHTPHVRSVIIVTSDKCYENQETGTPFVESDPMGGHDPYSASKGCAELVTASYVNSFFRQNSTAVATVRAGNVIGGGDFAVDRLIPDMVRAFKAGNPVHIRSPHATRPWQHVLEPLSGYLRLAKSLFEEGQEYVGAWNFGPEKESVKTVGEVVTFFSDLWGEGAAHQIDQSEQPHEAKLLGLDCSKVNNELGWKPKTDFEKAMEMTAEWYKEWANAGDVRSKTIKQIAEFEALK